MSCVTNESCSKWSQLGAWAQTNTTVPVPVCLCADSGFKWHHPLMTRWQQGCFGFIVVHWEEVEKLYLSCVMYNINVRQ